MARLILDAEIASLLTVEKVLPENWESRAALLPKSDRKFKQRRLELDSSDGRRFAIILRQSVLNVLDFSIILVFIDGDGCEYRLVRFNGTHLSEHTNVLERRNGKRNHTFKGVCHVHEATERYQLTGLKIDAYATPSKKYDSFETAKALFVKSNGFRVKADPQGYGSLFGERTS